MSLGSRTLEPRVLVPGVAATLSLDVYETSTNTRKTATAGTVQIKIGGRELLAATAVTAGAPSTYSMLATLTEDELPTDEWLERWVLTIDGASEEFLVAGHLARQRYRGTVVDADLAVRYRKITRLRDPDDTHFGTAIQWAERKIERWLIRKGRRPWLIFDPWALHDAHVALALYRIFDDADQELGDDTYERKATELLQEFKDEMGAINFRYDESNTGQIDDATQESAGGPIALTAGPGRRTVWVSR